MKKFLLFLAFLVPVGHFVKASFVTEKTTGSGTEAAIKTISLSEFEAKTGKKLTLLERFQFKQAQKMLNKGKLASPAKRQSLTRGFQFLPFIGSFFTLGLVGIIMLFTAKDQNALRWAWWGTLAVWSVLTILLMITLLNFGD